MERKCSDKFLVQEFEAHNLSFPGNYGFQMISFFCCCWVPFILSLAHRGVIWQEFHFWFPPVECGFFWREMQMKFRWTSSANPGWFYKARGRTPGAPLTYFNDGGVRQRFIFYTQKNPNFRICLPKKIPQCFCISKFYYLSSGKLKHANFNFGFLIWSKTKL